MLLDFDARRNNLRERRERGRTTPPVVSRSVFFCARVGPVVYIVLCVLRDTRREKEGERDFCVVVGFKRIISLSRVIVHPSSSSSRALFLSFALSLPRKKDDDDDDAKTRGALRLEKTISVLSLTKNSPPLCVSSLREEEERLHKSDRRE